MLILNMFSNTHNDDSVFERIYDGILIAFADNIEPIRMRLIWAKSHWYAGEMGVEHDAIAMNPTPDWGAHHTASRRSMQKKKTGCDCADTVCSLL